MLWLDLRAEPMVISVPAVDPKRYHSVQLVDGNTFIYLYVGSRATGSDAGDRLVVGPSCAGRSRSSSRRLRPTQTRPPTGCPRWTDPSISSCAFYRSKTSEPSILPAGSGTWKPPGVVPAA